MRETNRNSNVPRFVKRVEIVKKKSIMYYQPQPCHSFLKIVVSLPTMVAGCRGNNPIQAYNSIQIDSLGHTSTTFII